MLSFHEQQCFHYKDIIFYLMSYLILILSCNLIGYNLFYIINLGVNVH